MTIADSAVVVIDGSRDAAGATVVATVRVGDGAGAVALDPVTHDVFVANANDNTVSVIGPGTAGERPPTVTGSPTTAVAGRAYSYQFSVGGSPAPVDSVTAGTLPPGLALSTTGMLSGTPTNGGTYAFTVTAANAQGPPARDTARMKVDLAMPSDVAMALTGPRSAPFGSKFVERVTVTNHGPGRAFNIVTTLLVPVGLSLPPDPSGPASNPLVWSGTTLVPGASTSFAVSLTVTGQRGATEEIGGFAVSFASQDPNLANNIAVVEIRLGA